MINYNRLGYEIKTGFSKFLRKNFKWIETTTKQISFTDDLWYFNREQTSLSEIARSLNENITLKKTIDRLSRSN